MRRMWWILPAAVFLAFITAAGLFSVNVLTVRSGPPENRICRALRAEEGQLVRLRYRHSVERTLVEGRFRIGRGSLYIVETRMTSTGTGLPNTAVERSRRDGKWIVVDEGKRKIKSFPFYLEGINETHLFLADRDLKVGELPDGSLLCIGVEQVQLVRWWLWQLAGIPWRSPPESFG